MKNYYEISYKLKVWCENELDVLPLLKVPPGYKVVKYNFKVKSSPADDLEKEVNDSCNIDLERL